MRPKRFVPWVPPFFMAQEVEALGRPGAGLPSVPTSFSSIGFILPLFGAGSFGFRPRKHYFSLGSWGTLFNVGSRVQSRWHGGFSPIYSYTFGTFLPLNILLFNILCIM